MDENSIILTPIAHIETDFATKFGVPKQSGLVPELRARVVFEPKYRAREAVRGLEDYSHVWLVWRFSAAVRPDGDFSPTVRPPRLGGNRRVGVFASRSPFRPNSLGLSCVELAGIDYECADAPVLLVRGADLMNGTPILDVKPYVPYADSRPDARGGFTDEVEARRVRCEFPAELLSRVPESKRTALIGVLEQDPRPSYQDDPGRSYGFTFAGLEVRFRVEAGVLTVTDVIPN